MSGLDHLDTLFVVTAFLFQIILIIHFALRKWRFELALRYGVFVYWLSLAAVAVSIQILAGGKPWSFWIGGFIYLVWAVFGYAVEYKLDIQWRNPIRWPYFAPYVLLYLAVEMFYWWPLALIWKPLWYGYAVLFIISTILNISSHGPSKRDQQAEG
ncbi:MAG: hypothetical protein LLG42_00895 [Chloroflexi bacterium]|nr:hypothetical protein [Chloroflexota bacterium]